MESARSPPASNCHILTNSPALHSLKRQQLVQLCKRNGIKASGKNADIVEKLKAHALNHPFDSSSVACQSFFSSDDEGDKENKRIALPRPSEAWSVIEEDSREIERVHLGLKDIREEVEQEMSTMSPMKGFGAHFSGEFGSGTTSSKGSSMTSSLKAFASSLKRSGSNLKMSMEPSSTIGLPMHTEEPPALDTLGATSTPYHAHPHTYPQLPSPEPLDADDSRDQSMLDLGASTIRLVTTAPTAPSPPALRPFTPIFEPSYSPTLPYPPLPVQEDPELLPPGGFSDVLSTPSGPTKPSSPAAQPFIFGSPAHRISNTEFNSAASSVLAEMNARLGLTGTSNEVGLELLQNRRPTGQGGPLTMHLERPRTEVSNKFDRAHEREFEKMEGLGEWYARRIAASPGKSGSQDVVASKKRKSDALGAPHRRPIGPSNARTRRASRVVTPGTRRSLVIAADNEEADRRMSKRVRISVIEGGDRRTAAAASEGLDETGMEVDGGEGETNDERERERAAIKKKLEISRARRRSSMGRVSVGGGKPPLIPNQPKKGTATKFGFLSSAKTLVKNVWNRGVGTGTKPGSTIPVSKQSQATTAPTAKKPMPNVLIKPSTSVLKPPPSTTPVAKSDMNTSTRLPSIGLGLGRKLSTRTGTTTSTTGTRSSTASLAPTRSSTVSSSASGASAGRRGPIPSFPQFPSRMSRANSLASAGGTMGSRTSSSGTGSSRGATGASSIGMKKPGIATAVRSSGTGKRDISGIVNKRTSTLFAPTASSLAKMQSMVRPPSLSGTSAFSNVESKGLMKAPETRSPVPSGIPSFTFTSPAPVGSTATPSRATGSIFSGGPPNISSSQQPPLETTAPKPRALPLRRPRISRSRVIAKVGAQRAASGSSLSRTSSGRRSLNAPKARGSLGMRASGIGAKHSARDAAAMSARKRLRQSEILRRRSKISGVSPARLDWEETPDESREDNSTELEVDETCEGHSVSLDMSVES